MTTATQQQTKPQVGGSAYQDLVSCNRCGGRGIWEGPKSSGTCFACRGSGLLERARAERYLGRPAEQQPYPEPDPAEQAMAKALNAVVELGGMGWIMQAPVQLEGRTELLGRHPKKTGRTLHITWVHAQRTRISEWLEGPPSKHRDLLTEDA